MALLPPGWRLFADTDEGGHAFLGARFEGGPAVMARVPGWSPWAFSLAMLALSLRVREQARAAERASQEVR